MLALCKVTRVTVHKGDLQFWVRAGMMKEPLHDLILGRNSIHLNQLVGKAFINDESKWIENDEPLLVAAHTGQLTEDDDEPPNLEVMIFL